MQQKRIVVTGMGIVSCFGTDVDIFYDKLLAGESGVTCIDQFPCQDYPTRFAASIKNFDPGDYIDKKQARRIDPFISYALVAGKKALQHAGFDLNDMSSLQKERCGILIGSGMGGMQVFCDGAEALITKGLRRISPFFVPFIITNMGGALLAIDVGFMGPNYSVSTACATSNHSILLAANHIRKGEADLMVCGGSEAAIIPLGVAGFVACKALSERNDDPRAASRPWDKNRDGFVMGEGSGVLVLESLEHALKRGAPILAEYLGGGMSCDANHITDPRSDGQGVKNCISQALQDARLPLERIDYINAHATSTPVGDMAEIKAIKQVFGPHIHHVKMNATKSMIGHCLGAAGGLEAIATIKAIQTGKLHPTINLHDPEPEIEGIDVIQNRSKEHKIDAALSNSFGFGGHNCSLVFGRYSK